MKLTKKHIGGLFDVRGSDGSWCYQLVAIKGDDLLFYALDGKYWVERKGKTDWRPFAPQMPDENHIKYGWASARRID